MPRKPTTTPSKSTAKRPAKAQPAKTPARKAQPAPGRAQTRGAVAGRATAAKSTQPAQKAPVKKAAATVAKAVKAAVKSPLARKAAPAKAVAKVPAKAPAKAPAKVVAKVPAKAPVKAPAKAPAKVVAKAPAKAPAKPAVKVKSRGDQAAFFARQKELLLEERASYMKAAEALKAQADSLALEHEPGDVQFDEEGGEGGTANVDREMDLHLSAQARATVLEIDHALGKIADGTYGLCEHCGDLIPEPRLQALPHAALCVTCKSGGLSSRR